MLLAGPPGAGKTLLAELRQFTGGVWEQEDDITLVALRHCASAGQAVLS